MRLSLVWLTILMVGLGSAQAIAAPRAKPIWLSGFVMGWHGPGWWSFKIETGGRLEVSADVRSSRTLSAGERERLQGLVAALPTERTRYSFGAPGAVDASPCFVLEVHQDGTIREFAYYPLGLTGERTPVIDALVVLWRFIRGLFKSSQAAGPDEYLTATGPVGGAR